MRRRNRLVTLVFSHFNEKARWALDYCGVDYEEQRFLPVFSQVGVMVATRGRGGQADEVSTRFSTPVLVTSDGQRLCDSTDIARWASKQAMANGADPLFPDDEVRELVERYGRGYGADTRRAVFWHAFRSKKAFTKMATANVGPVQALAFRAMSPVNRPAMRKLLEINDEAYARSLAKIREVVEDAGRRLERSKYLVGDRFTAADLTFAALSAPILLVTRDEGYSATFPSVDDFEPDGRELVDEMRRSRAGKFALEVFRRHRHSRAAESAG